MRTYLILYIVEAIGLPYSDYFPARNRISFHLHLTIYGLKLQILLCRRFKLMIIHEILGR